MKNRAILLVALLVAFGAGSLATAATGWKVFATATDNGEYSTYASANSKVVNPNGLAMRVSGPVTEVSWNFSCEGGAKRIAGNRVVLLTVKDAKSCSVYGSAFGGEGTLRLQLLRK